MKRSCRASAVIALACGAAACAGLEDGDPDQAMDQAVDRVADQALVTDGALAHRAATRYLVLELDSLGGGTASGNSINDLGWVAGSSTLPGNQTQHATLWRYGSTTDLGTLGGPNSGVSWPVKNDRGLVVGIAETAEDDPLGEAWSCSAFFPTVTGKICRGFVWERGVMRALPTLGGNNGYATGANRRAQVVGWAENTIADPTCNPPQVLQFRALVWGPGRDQIQELPPLPGDTTSAATAINDRGQVVGISGICDNAVGRFSAAHAVMWEDGVATDLGSLGGISWNTPVAINRRGDVVGFSNVEASAGGSFRAQAFLWTRGGGIQPLGTLPGDVYSQALGINERRQVVGTSCTAGFASCRAFVWEDGVMTDLDAAARLGDDDPLTTANDINELGVITGAAVDDDGNQRAAVVIPLPGFLAQPR